MPDRRLLVAIVVAAATAIACRGRQPDSAAASKDHDRSTLGVLDRANDAPSVAALGKTVAVAWNARTEQASDVYVSVSTDGGASFGAPTRVNRLVKDASITGEQPARIALAAATRSTSFGPHGTRSVPSSATRRPPISAGRSRRRSRSWVTASPVSVAGTRSRLDTTGVHVLWLDGRHAAPHHQHSGGAPQPASMPRRAPRQDVFHLSWKGDGLRTESAVAANACFCSKTAIATAGDRVYAAWRHIFPHGVRDIAVARSLDNGATFGEPARLSEDNWKIEVRPDDGPSMAADSHGGIHVAWPALVPGEPPRKRIFYASLPYDAAEGAPFSPRLRLDDGDADAAHPQIASDDHGNVAVVWDERTGDRRRTVLRRVSAGTATPAERFEAVGASYPAVAAAAGAWIVVWPAQTPEGLTMIEARRIRFAN